MKIGDLVYPFHSEGDYEIGVFMGIKREYSYGVEAWVFWDGMKTTIPFHQLKLVSVVRI